ncbi:MAG: hypothetical protein ACPG7F_03220 [Aggregatilineales bacterium]
MSQFDNLRKLAGAAATVRDIAIERRSYHFQVNLPAVLYLDIEYSHVQIHRDADADIRIDSALQAGFGWRVETDQDDAGVYVVVKRRVLVGSFAKAQFDVYLPPATDLILKLTQCALTLHDIDATLHLSDGERLQLRSE